MKHHRTERVEVEQKVRTHVTCDACGGEYRWDKLLGSDAWEEQCRVPNPSDRGAESSRFWQEDIDVRRRAGLDYPGGGTSKHWSYDVCPRCFMEKIVPLMEHAKDQPTESWW